MTPEERSTAPCAGRTELFYSDSPADQAEAKALCFGCPLQLQCLVEGLPEIYGIWGGTGPADRRRLRKAAR